MKEQEIDEALIFHDDNLSDTAIQINSCNFFWSLRQDDFKFDKSTKTQDINSLELFGDKVEPEIYKDEMENSPKLNLEETLLIKEKKIDNNKIKNKESNDFNTSLNAKLETKNLQNKEDDDRTIEPSTKYVDSQSFINKFSILKNININVKKGEFIGLIGEVGSGKSSLLQAIMNNLIVLNSQNNLKIEDLNKIDISRFSQKILVNGDICYTSQIPWIQNETFRNNVLFFEKFDQNKYEKILKITQLKHDIENFEGNDLIEIGEKGINLSGGQKARVSLARALYSDGDIYLLDDPLAALDADVGKKVFKECFLDHLRDKTRILATHNLNYMMFFDRIIWIGNNKQIIFNGKHEDLLNLDFYQEFLKSHNAMQENEKQPQISIIEENLKENDNEAILCSENRVEINSKSANSKNLHSGLNVNSKIESNDSIDMNEDDIFTKNVNTTEDRKNADKQMNSIYRTTKDEDQEMGSIKFEVFIKYFKYMGGRYIIFILCLMMFLWITMKTCSDLWLSDWTKEEKERIFNIKNKWINYGIYSGLSLSSILFISFRMVILSRGTLKINKNLHNDMVKSLVKAPINLFHDSTPKGIIYNRLSKDLENIQYNMYAIGSLLVDIFGIFGGIVICGLFNYYCLAFVPFLILFGYFIYNHYIQTSRELQRLEGITRSPMINIISESITGASLIRIFNKSQFYKNKFYEKVDDNLMTNIFINGCRNWFALFIEFLSLLFILFLIVFAVLFQDMFNPQAIALMLNYTYNLQFILFDFFQEIAIFQNNIISMERCLNFLNIPQEKSSKLKSDDLLDEVRNSIQHENVNEIKKHDDYLYAFENHSKEDSLNKMIWPTMGEIDFIDYSVKYRPEMPVILKNLNFKIKSREKIGIVGRTGSGKSTICNSIFRILEASSGTIIIDNVDISKVGLNKLRKSLTIIPQDPCIIQGTLKYNIDPLEKFMDEEIRDVLKRIGFSYENYENGIYKEIGDQGDNLSVGEKQLICIARAILRV